MGAVPVTLRLVVALLLGCGGLLLPAAPALAACPPGNATLEAQTKRADEVFTGRVADRRPDARAVVYTIAVDRVYKGEVDTADVTVSTERSVAACGLPRLEPGESYVFFTSTDGQDRTTDQRSGTSRASGGKVARVEELLGAGRPPTPPEPVEATFTLVADEPPTLERVAAPGAALVILGVLGLLLAAILGRRTS